MLLRLSLLELHTLACFECLGFTDGRRSLEMNSCRHRWLYGNEEVVLCMGDGAVVGWTAHPRIVWLFPFGILVLHTPFPAQAPLDETLRGRIYVANGRVLDERFES